MSSETFNEGTQDGSPQPLEVLTAFTVVVDAAGRAWALTDAFPEGLAARRRADEQAVKAACTALVEDIRSSEVARRVAEALAPEAEPTNAERVSKRLEERRA